MTAFTPDSGKCRPTLTLILSLLMAAPGMTTAATNAYQVEIWGSVPEAIGYWKQRDFWGPVERGQTLSVPRVITVAINKSWKQEAKQLPVADKKALFYRAMLPLILTANEHILHDRSRIEAIAGRQAEGQAPSTDELVWLRQLAGQYRLFKGGEAPVSDADIVAKLDELLQRVDIIPPGLALGQGAYESGYGSSRFALTGNALFGQWTWGGNSMKPQQQRKGKGNYGVAAYDWPFDSVRAYILNLNTQRAYAGLRQQRARLRAAGKPITGLALVGSLSKYSERGQAYVDTLSGIIKKNKLDVADDARLRDEGVVLIVGAEDVADKAVVEQEIAALRASGELDERTEAMQLEAAPH